MNKRTLLVFGFILMLLPTVVCSETYWGGELPDINDTELKAEVTFDGEIYTYSYTIISGSANTGQIWSFDIDIKQPREGMELSGEGLITGPGYLQHSSAQVLSEPTTPKMVPVGLFSPPNWNSGPNVFGQVGWGANDDLYMINTGQVLNGFQINSRGLPGIRDFRIEPDLIPPSAGDTEDTEVISLEEYKKVEDKVAFTGKTIGPTAPPKLFWPKKFLETIRNYIDESVTLGWLIDADLIITLQNKLDTALSYIEANDPSSAKEALQHFMTALKNASSSQRSTEAYGLLYFNAQYLYNQLPDTYVPPPPPVLELKPEEATLPIGTIHTLTATLTQDSNPLQGYSVYVEVISGPNEGLLLEGFTDSNGQVIFSYTSTKVGMDELVARATEMPALAPEHNRILLAMNDIENGVIPVLGISLKTYTLMAQGGGSDWFAESPPVKVIWIEGPDLIIELFIPPVIKTKGGEQITITEITGNVGNTSAGESITRYFLSDNPITDPAAEEVMVIGERVVLPLEPGTSSNGGSQRYVLPEGLSESTYYMVACADANQVVVELNEQNNCDLNQVVIAIEAPLNQPPDCTQASPSIDILWPPNHKLVTISIQGITDPDGDETTLTITGITQDEPVNGLGDGDTSPDGFGIGTAEAQIRAERSGTGNGRVYAVSFKAEDGNGGTCTGYVNVGVPHDQGKGAVPIDDGQNYDSTQP